MTQRSHREQLLRGAIECLQSKGYARTTARDIATAANANLASIGYHFGSKEELLNEALIGLFEQWTQQLGEITLTAPGASPLERLEIAWRETLEGFEEHRMLVVAFVEAMAQVERSEQLCERMSEHYQSLRVAVATLIANALGDDHQHPTEQTRALASILIALCDGFALQWLIDPHGIPNPRPLLDTIGELLEGKASTSIAQT